MICTDSIQTFEQPSKRVDIPLCWLVDIGILLLMAYYNPQINGLYNPLYTANNQGFVHCSFTPPNIYCLKLIEFQNTHSEAIGNAHHDTMPWNWIQHQLNKSDCPTSRLPKSFFYLYNCDISGSTVTLSSTRTKDCFHILVHAASHPNEVMFHLLKDLVGS